jgi:hypothetical protein
LDRTRQGLERYVQYHMRKRRMAAPDSLDST